MTDFNDPLAVFQAALTVLNAEDWYAAAALVDPISLRVFVDDLRSSLALKTPRRRSTVDDYMKADAELPRAVAEYYVARCQREVPGDRFTRELDGVDSIDALQTMPREEVFARWLIARSPRRQLERIAAARNIALPVVETPAGSFATFRYKAIGTVQDESGFAYVLYRGDIDPEQPWSGRAAEWLANKPADEQRFAREMHVFGHPRAAPLRRQPDGTWRLVVDQAFLLGVGALDIVGFNTVADALKAKPDAE